MRPFGVYAALIIFIAGIAGLARDGTAKLAEPDVVYYGKVAGGTAGTVLTLKLAADSTVLASAALAADTSFTLRVPMDFLEPRASGTARTGDGADFYVGTTKVRALVIPAPGSLVGITVPATPRTEDDWKSQHPEDDGSGDMNRNGITDLQDFLNGNDPAACVWTDADASHLETTVYHAQVLQNCLTEAQADGRHNLIKVAEGVYYGNYTYVAEEAEEFDLRLSGGYDFDGSGERGSEPSGTVLVGDKDQNEAKDGRVLDILAGKGQTPSTVRIEGFRIMYGGTDWNSDTDPDAADGLRGGGVRVRAGLADVELTGNMFSDNFAFWGGAVLIESGDGSVLLVNNVFSNNAAFRAGAVMISSAGNGAVTLLNNTLADNWAEGEGPGNSLLIENASGPVELTNNIIRGVWVGESDTAIKSSEETAFPLTVSNNNMLPSLAFATDLPGFAVDATNTTDDPAFVRLQTMPYYYFPTDGDYRLRKGSPCRDKGTAHPLLPSGDPDGRERILGAAVDMGAYEMPAGYDDEPVVLSDPIFGRTRVVAEGFVNGALVTNRSEYTVSGRVESPFELAGLTVQRVVGYTDAVGPLEVVPLASGNAFTYAISLPEPETWLHFEVAKADGAKVTFWYVIYVDTTAPAAALDSVSPQPTNASPIPVTVVFSKEVSGFDASGVVVENGLISSGSFTGAGASYSFTVTPAADGPVSVSVPEGGALDAAGNSNLASESLEVTYDATAPVPVMSSAVDDPTYASSIPVSVAFGEQVAGFDASDVVVRNGTLASFSGSGAAYSLVITPTAQNVLVTVDLVAGAASDEAGNPSMAAAQFTRSYAPAILPSGPSVAVSPPDGAYKTAILVEMTATDDVDIHYTLNGVRPTVNSPLYTGPLALSETTTVRCFAVDAAGNSGEEKSVSYTIDATPPVLRLSTLSDGKATNTSVLNVSGTVSDAGGLEEVTLNDAPVTVGPDGSFSAALTLSTGPNAIVTEAVDRAGNVARDARVITLDQDAPGLLVASPADNSKTASGTVEVSGETEEGASVLVTVNDGEAGQATAAGRNFSFAASLAAGVNTIEITTEDPAGNRTAAKRTVAYYDKKPSLAVTEPGQDVKTNEETLLLKGTASDPQSTVSVVISTGTATFEPQVADGAFEQLLPFTEERGYELVVTATNEAGGYSTVTRNIIFDKTPPALSIDPVETPTNDRSQTVTGSLEAGSTLIVSCPTASVGDVAYPTAASWSVEISGFSLGRNELTATAEDRAGNRTEASATIMVGNIYSGPKTVTLSVPAGMTIYYTTDGTTPTTSANEYAGPVTLTETATFSYIAVDALGNSGPVMSVLYTIDTAAPVLTVSTPLDGAYTSKPVLTVTGKVSDNLRVKELAVNGNVVALSPDGSYGYDVVLTTGANAITVEAYDAANNRTTSVKTVTLDTEAPALELSTLPDGAVTNNDTLNVSGMVSDEAGLGKLELNGAEAAVGEDGGFSRAVSLVPGPNVITVIARDSVGNGLQETRTIILDQNAPLVTISTPADNGKTKVAAVTVTGLVDKTAAVELTLNGEDRQLLRDGLAFSSYLNLEAGVSTIVVKAVDPAGHSSAVKRTITLDEQAPSLSITVPSEDLTVGRREIAVKGTVSDALGKTSLKIEADGKNYSPEVLNGGFAQLITLSGEELHVITITATDEAGDAIAATRNVIYRPPTQTALPGDLNNDGGVDVGDAVIALRIAVGLEAASPELLARGDVAPLINGRPGQDGVIDVSDALVILEWVVNPPAP